MLFLYVLFYQRCLTVFKFSDLSSIPVKATLNIFSPLNIKVTLELVFVYFVSDLLTNAYDYIFSVGVQDLTFLQAITANSFFLDLNVRVAITCHM